MAIPMGRRGNDRRGVAFIVMGLAFTLYRDGRWATLLVIGFVWNALHVAVFTAVSLHLTDLAAHVVDARCAVLDRGVLRDLSRLKAGASHEAFTLQLLPRTRRT